MANHLTNDRDIRKPLVELAALEHAASDLAVIEEVQIEGGTTRIDLLAVNGSMHGYEIKSDLDNFSRLPTQMGSYSSTLDTVTLVIGKSHLREARQAIPIWWGIIVAEKVNGVTTLTRKRSAKKNPVNVLAQQLRLATSVDLKRLLTKQGFRDVRRLGRYRLNLFVMKMVEEKKLCPKLLGSCIRDAVRGLPAKRTALREELRDDSSSMITSLHFDPMSSGGCHDRPHIAEFQNRPS